jgi:hypothetical protein
LACAQTAPGAGHAEIVNRLLGHSVVLLEKNQWKFAYQTVAIGPILRWVTTTSVEGSHHAKTSPDRHGGCSLVGRRWPLTGDRRRVSRWPKASDEFQEVMEQGRQDQPDPALYVTLRYMKEFDFKNRIKGDPLVLNKSMSL